jgi:hypothetical protein
MRDHRARNSSAGTPTSKSPFVTRDAYFVRVTKQRPAAPARRRFNNTSWESVELGCRNGLGGISRGILFGIRIWFSTVEVSLGDKEDAS